MTPAELVVEAFGGVRATARVINISPSTVCRWVNVPIRFIPVILGEARRLGLNLSAEHIIDGAPDVERRVIRRLL